MDGMGMANRAEGKTSGRVAKIPKGRIARSTSAAACVTREGRGGRRDDESRVPDGERSATQHPDDDGTAKGKHKCRGLRHEEGRGGRRDDESRVPDGERSATQHRDDDGTAKGNREGEACKREYGDRRREEERGGRRGDESRAHDGKRSGVPRRDEDDAGKGRHREEDHRKGKCREEGHRKERRREDEVCKQECGDSHHEEKSRSRRDDDSRTHDRERSRTPHRDEEDTRKRRHSEGDHEKERHGDGKVYKRTHDGADEFDSLGRNKAIKRKCSDGELEWNKGGDTIGTTRSNSEKDNHPADSAHKPGQLATGRTGGVYVPPFKIAQMMKDIQDKSGPEYQRMTWDALRKSINGLVNKVNASNIKNIIPELFSENLIRGRGLFARSCMKSQMASPAFTHVFAALVAVVNTKFPELGELILKRIILQLRRALRRNDKPLLLAAAKFIAHLVNQQVAHEVVALEILMVLLENPTDDSVEVAVGFVKECGAMLQDLAPQGVHGIFERFRGILHEGEIDKRVQFMIEGLFAIRKANFQGHQAVLPELDLVEQEDQITHEISLDAKIDDEKALDVFKADPSYLENEKKYESVKVDILGEESEDDSEAGNNSEDNLDDDEDDESEEENQKLSIKDETETNLVNLRRTIYLTIMSSVDFEEAGHKLLKIKLESGQEMELCVMLLECCSQERTYLRYYGLLGQRFCLLNQIYQANFDECFMKQYSMIHRLETNKLRNVAKFFAHLLATDALPWNALAYIRLTEEDTTSSSRIFIKILFQELSEHLGLRKLNERLNDPLMQESFEGIFPKDNPKNTRFAINFFTSIGLGGITDSLREYLKNMPRFIMQQQKPVDSESDDEESSGPSDTSTSESGSSESGSDSDGSDASDSTSGRETSSDDRRKHRRR